MRYMNTQTVVGLFGLVTLILALMVVGRLFGLGVWEAVYLAALLLTGVGSLLYRLSCRTGAK